MNGTAKFTALRTRAEHSNKSRCGEQESSWQNSAGKLGLKTYPSFRLFSRKRKLATKQSEYSERTLSHKETQQSRKNGRMAVMTSRHGRMMGIFSLTFLFFSLSLSCLTLSPILIKQVLLKTKPYKNQDMYIQIKVQD